MKVVINKCFGGFGLSIKALKLLDKWGSKLVEYTPAPEYFRNSRSTPEEVMNQFAEWKLRAEPAGEGYLVDGLGGALLRLKDNVFITYDRGYDAKSRTEPDLIKVVEELGSKRYP